MVVVVVGVVVVVVVVGVVVGVVVVVVGVVVVVVGVVVGVVVVVVVVVVVDWKGSREVKGTSGDWGVSKQMPGGAWSSLTQTPSLGEKMRLYGLHL